jgi:glycosyltransferase involved in cell wall biosynthesis
VSVVINTYNYERYLPKAIESALRQHTETVSVEVVVVDDGSTDRTPEIAAEYSAVIMYHRQSNGGQALAIQKGLRLASGEILCLLDADDEFTDGKIQQVIDAFRAAPQCGAIYNSYICVDGTGVPQGPRFVWPRAGKNVRQYGLFWQAGGVPTSCISLRREIAHRLHIPEEFRICADTYILAALPHLTEIGWIGSALTTYRIHGANGFAALEPTQRKVLLQRNWRVTHSALLNQYGIELSKAVFEIQEQRACRHVFGTIAWCAKGLRYIYHANASPTLKLKEIVKLALAAVGLHKPLAAPLGS